MTERLVSAPTVDDGPGSVRAPHPATEDSERLSHNQSAPGEAEQVGMPYRVNRGGWITTPPNRANPLCEWHQGLCAYLAHDRTRCPWCHSSWGVILRADSHSCERPGAWTTTERAWRVAEAVRMRSEAAEDRDQGTARPRWLYPPIRGGRAPSHGEASAAA